MKKVLMFVLFLSGITVLSASQAFAQWTWYYADVVTDPAAEINISSTQISVSGNVFQPGGWSIGPSEYVKIYNACVGIDTYENIGNITVSNSSAAINGLVSGGNYIGNIFIDIDTSGSVGNINANQNFISIKDMSNVNGVLCSADIYIEADKTGNITANSNKIEVINSHGWVAYVFGTTIGNNIASSSSYTITANANEVSVTSSSVEYSIYGSNMGIGGVANITSDNNKVTVAYSTAGSIIGANVGSYSDFDMKNMITQANNNSVSISNSYFNSSNSEAFGTSGSGANVITNNNSLSIENSLRIVNVYGAYSSALFSAKANNNSVSVKNTTARSGYDTFICGGALDGGDFISWDVYKNKSDFGVFEAIGNSVRIENLTGGDSLKISGAYGDIYAGIGKVNNNSVYILNSSTSEYVFGGDIQSNGDALATELYANENTVTLVNSMANAIYGGSSLSQNTAADYNPITDTFTPGGKTLNFANSNKVLITSGNVLNVWGAYADSKTSNVQANNNKVEISYSTVSYVTGVWARSYTDDPANSTVQSNNNSISISNSNLSGNCVSGAETQGDNVFASGNSVSIENSLRMAYVYGAYSDWAQLSAKINGNSVSVKNINANNDVYIYGAQLYCGGMGSPYENIGHSGFETNNNSVRIENLTSNDYTEVNGAYIGLEAGIGAANQNSVYMLNSNVSSVFGGHVYSEYDWIAREQYANQNSVTLINSTSTYVYGGYAYSDESRLSSVSASGSGNTLSVANGNKVSITGGSVYVVDGGYAESESSNAQANNNSVTLENLSGTVYYICGSEAYGKFDGGKVQAINNTVTIIGNLDVSDGIYGGWAQNLGTGGFDDITGNTLNVKGGYITTDVIYGFENYNFYIQDANITSPILSIANGYSGNTLDLSSANVKVILGKGVKLNTGDEIVLMQNSSVTGIASELNNSQIVTKQGITKINTFNLHVDTAASAGVHTLNATLIAINANSDVKALSEGVAGAVIAAGQAADMANGNLLSSGLQEGQLEVIGAAFGGISKYNTGSSVDVTAFGAVAGIGMKLAPLSAGVFVEYVNASFDTEYNGITGNGKASAIGGGVLAKKDINKNLYAEGMIRGGQVSNDYTTELADEEGITADFDHNSIYFGLALGGGCVYQINEKISIDGYGRYVFTNTGGTEVDLPTGEKFKFDYTMSNRIIIGAKGDYKINDMFTPYAALSYDYELSGDITAKIDGADIEVPTLNGGTFVFGLGSSAKVMEGLTLDLSINGYGGVRQGFSGFLKLKYEI
ncbi:MAG: autotransporter outer membrane beta-barrel domain-containing protein [Endomicrobia bacterium]|nr:autotransporter outer membrane beta-barrel domain-containing protein [Endomicrobiia bacterium]MCL2506429.1 autotransporter outer membrane beta-barrel domain-containing protein [Endomicrobiia bacterium]